MDHTTAVGIATLVGHAAIASIVVVLCLRAQRDRRSADDRHREAAEVLEQARRIMDRTVGLIRAHRAEARSVDDQLSPVPMQPGAIIPFPKPAGGLTRHTGSEARDPSVAG